MSSRARWPVAAPLVMGALALGVAACGGGGAATAAGSSASQQDTARLQLAKCLRDHGVDVPDNPGSGQGGEGGGGGFRRSFGTAGGRAKFQAAMKACAKYRAAAFGNVTPQQRQEFQDAFVKFSACMRQHGVDVPTPNFNGGGPPAGGGVRRRLDRSDPKVAAALQACQGSLPNGGRFGGGRFGPGGGPPPGTATQ